MTPALRSGRRTRVRGATGRSARGLDRVRADWVTLATADPMWAVLVTPGGRDGGWEPTEFYATGRDEVARVLARAADLGARPGRGVALDFGCGVGRLTSALAEHADAVIGVDVSPPMIEQARREDTTGRCTFVLNEADDLSVIPDASVDIVYSSLVLQHIPAPFNVRFLGELIRVLRPGGLLAVQLATRPDGSARGTDRPGGPRTAMRFAQRVLLRYPAPMEMHPISAGLVEDLARSHGADVLGADDEPMYGGHWVYTRYFVTKRGRAGDTTVAEDGP